MRRTSMRESGLPGSWNARGLWRRVVIASILLVCVNAPRALAENPQSSAFFESRIRPILVEKCYKCHSSGAVRIKGGLRLDGLEGMLKGGDSGPAVVPGKPSESLLLLAIAHTEDFSKMPPKEKLPEQVVMDFRRWVEMGATYPRASNQVAGPANSKSLAAAPPARADDGSWWSLQPISSPDPPRPARARPAGPGTPSTPSSLPVCGRRG